MTDGSKNSISSDDIDRKKYFRFGDRTPDSEIDVIIVKTNRGITLFNKMVGKMNYQEKEARPISPDSELPVYVTVSEEIRNGCRFGAWRYFTDLAELAGMVSLDKLEDNFSEFQMWMTGFIK